MTKRDTASAVIPGRGETPRLEQSMFDPLVGTEFRVVLSEQSAVTVDLVESVALPARGDLPNRREPFSLLFRGARDLDLEQKTYSIDHADLGRLELFLVPIGPGEYEAVLN